MSDSDSRENPASEPSRAADADDSVLLAVTAAILSGPARLPPGTVVADAYRIESVLGVGGMGVVYAASDLALDRRVALKMHISASERRSNRMRREAKAMARLAHPNVVTVYEVGDYEGRTFVAMELVEGKTLGHYIRDEGPRWPRVVELFMQAGRGLQAAHDKGLVHRDFKPDNVMVDTMVRVRVMDFGLARMELEHVSLSGSGSGSGSGSDAGSDEAKPARPAGGDLLTRKGAVVGTPAYMAPEQLRGDVARAAADQFAFCVSLWEAVHGQRPFPGRSVAELADNVSSGKMSDPLPGTRVPRWLRRALLRGLAAEPSMRWPSIAALLRALSVGRARARVKWALAMTGVAAVAIAGVFGWQDHDRRQRVALCEQAGATIEQTVNPQAQADIRTALLSTKISYAGTTADKVMPWINAQAQAWSTARTQTCMRAEIEHTWNAAVEDRALWCLEGRRLELAALIEELSQGSATSVRRAVDSVSRLRPVAACKDAEMLLRLPPPPTHNRDRASTLRTEIARGRALKATGDRAAAEQVARAAVADADALQWPPLVATARVLLGSILSDAGEYADAEQELEAGYFEATQAGAYPTAAAAAEALVSVVGDRLERHVDGLRWSRHLEAIPGLPDVARLREARRIYNVANVHARAGAYEQAKAEHERALILFESAHGPVHPDLARALVGLGTANWRLGANEEALAYQQRAIEIWEQTLGAGHPLVGYALSNRSAVYSSMGAYDDAQAVAQRALASLKRSLGPEHTAVASCHNNLGAIFDALNRPAEAARQHELAGAILEAALGPDHPSVATSLTNLGVVRSALGDHEEAKALLRRALAINEKALGKDHPSVGGTLMFLGAVAFRERDFERAKELYQRTLEIEQKALGPEHADVATDLNAIAAADRELGNYDEAVVSCDRALIIVKKALGPENPKVSRALMCLAEVAVARQRFAEARPHVEQAVALLEGTAMTSELADARSMLARVAWETDADKSQALELARLARETYRAGGDSQADALAELDGWLARR